VTQQRSVMLDTALCK